MIPKKRKTNMKLVTAPVEPTKMNEIEVVDVDVVFAHGKVSETINLAAGDSVVYNEEKGTFELTRNGNVQTINVKHAYSYATTRRKVLVPEAPYSPEKGPRLPWES